MITVQEFIERLNKFPKDMQIVMSNENEEAIDPLPTNFQLTENNHLNKSSGKYIVLIDHLRPFR